VRLREQLYFYLIFYLYASLASLAPKDLAFAKLRAKVAKLRAKVSRLRAKVAFD
jgi:hypothetical protein